MHSKLRLVIGFAYIPAGIFLLYYEFVPGIADPGLMRILGVVFVAYGIYRIVHTRLLMSGENQHGRDEE